MTEKTTRTPIYKNIFKTDKEIEKYLNKSLKKDSIEDFLKALGEVAKSEGYTNIGGRMGITRQGLHKIFSKNAKPRFETVYNLLNSLGLKISLTSKK